MSEQILNIDELRSLEKRYSNELPEGELMRRAGTALAEEIARITPEAGHVVFVCGAGNNGGDGFVAARVLKAQGFKVTCALIGVDKPKTKDALAAFNAWEAAGGLTIADPYNAEKADTVVDALLGIGIDKPIRGELQDAAMWFNEREAVHVSVDIPSGLNPITGNWVGGAKGCKADITVAMFSPKAGCFMNDGADAAGRVIVRELDVSVPLTQVGLIEKDDFRHFLEPRAKNSHKGDFGHVLVIGGEKGTVGAAILAARAAVELGAGRVTCELMAEGAPLFDVNYPEILFSEKPIDLTKVNAIVIGCGLGFSDRAITRLKEVIAAEIPLIIDADALRLLAKDQKLQDAVLARKAHTVITPHPAEAADLLHRTTAKVLEDRIASARELSIQTGAITILKGAGTVVALRSSRTWINPSANGVLATAGSGDVLSGMLGAVFAQGFDLVTATLAATWLHSEGVRNRLAGVRASDLAPAASKLLEELRSEYRKSKNPRL